MVQSFGSSPAALTGALGGIACAVVLGYLIAQGAVRINLRTFFRWSGAFLIVVAAGVLAYGIMDLQEARVIPGPFSTFAPIDAVGGGIATGLNGIPWGWAFDVRSVIAPGGVVATLLQATVGFMPAMTWVQVFAWATYIVVVTALYFRSAPVLRRRARLVPHPQGASS